VPLPEPELRLGGWYRYYLGSGATVPCTHLGSCGSATYTLAVPESVSEAIALGATWIPPQTKSGVAWRVRIEAAGGLGAVLTAAALCGMRRSRRRRS
jgi:hypothetical protein